MPAEMGAPYATFDNSDKEKTMTSRPRTPFDPIPQRPERHDETWERRRDPIAYQAVQEMERRGY